MDTPSTNQELAELYDRAYASASYRMGDDRKRRAIEQVLEVVDEEPVRSMLDVGCGRGELLTAFVCIETVHGAEIVDKLCNADAALAPIVWKIETAADLSLFADGEYELVTSFDMIEHILPEETEAVLRELWRVATRAVRCSIALYSDVWEQEMHINLRPVGEWCELLNRCFDGGSVRIDVQDHGSGEKTLWVRGDRREQS